MRIEPIIGKVFNMRLHSMNICSILRLGHTSAMVIVGFKTYKGQKYWLLVAFPGLGKHLWKPYTFRRQLKGHLFHSAFPP